MTTTQMKRGVGQAGITLIELTIAAFIAGMLSLVMSTMIKSYTRATKVGEEKLKAVGEGLLGTRALWQDVRQAGISFNMINGLMDDNGKPFYDFLPDGPCAPTVADPNRCRRTLTLDKDHPTREFILAMTVDGLMAPTPVAPGLPFKSDGTGGFYNQPPPANNTVAGTITFDGTAFKNTMLFVDKHPVKMWKPNSIVRFYSPFFQRYVAPGGMPVMTDVPRMLSYIGFVTSDMKDATITAAQLDSLKIGAQRRPDMSSTDPNGPLTSVDKFFRSLPPVGGTGAFGLVVPITFVRYALREITLDGQTKLALMRDKHDGNGFTTTTAAGSRMIAFPVKSLTLNREDITVPAIRPAMVIDKRTYRELMQLPPSKAN